MILPKENVTDKKEILKQLNKIFNLEEKSSKLTKNESKN